MCGVVMNIQNVCVRCNGSLFDDPNWLRRGQEAPKEGSGCPILCVDSVVLPDAWEIRPSFLREASRVPCILVSTRDSWKVYFGVALRGEGLALSSLSSFQPSGRAGLKQREDSMHVLVFQVFR